MGNANDEPTTAQVAGRASRRDAIGASLRECRPFVAAELLLIPILLALRGYGVIRNPSLLILLIGWLSLWLRRTGWRGVGLGRPANWRWTILLGLGIGIAYDAADILVFLPALRQLTGEAVQLDQLGDLRGNVGALLLLLALTWTLAAFGEEMAYRGYALNRIADLFGRSQAAFVASAILVSGAFGFAHIGQGVTGVLDNVLAGMMFAALYLASGRNLWLPIIVHGVVDTTSLVLLFLGVSPS
ncbi:MAG: CPBP family intramembrane metalloprotease [Planctomycetes bacterium]|nr:CPBP family intramembrane metalloprotease [Planctomycetota bacterium]